LLRPAPGDVGSASVDLIASLVLLIALTLGGIQLGLTLHARNVLMAAVHDGARRGVELGSSNADAVEIATRFVDDAAGGLVSDPHISARTHSDVDEFVIELHLDAHIDVPGPVPIKIPFSTNATASRSVRP
jgi:hypothetical protein